MVLLPCSYFLFIVITTAGLVMGIDFCTVEKQFGGHGPEIRFPFTTSESANCGYPGFFLSCADGQHAELELPNSVRLFVSKIDYANQLIHATDPNNCFAGQMQRLDLTRSPFNFSEPLYLSKFSIFNCGSSSTSPYVDENVEKVPIPCLGTGEYQVYAVSQDDRLDDVSLLNCTKRYDIESPVPSYAFSENKDLLLNWSRPDCRSCEVNGQLCRLKHNGSLDETECYDRISIKHKSCLEKNLLVSGVVIGLFLLSVALIALYRKYRFDKSEKEYRMKVHEFLNNYKTMQPSRYSYTDIKRITNQFKDKLGQGAYGTVFKGKLSDEIVVAVKVLNSLKEDGEEFVNEVGTMGRIHHVNVVRLIGFCADGFKRALVYEYLPNDSLEKFITSADDKSRFLGWKRLQEIALGTARGIEYLHQGCDQRILHFDIKPHNVLLDEDFNPKISDFGLAKLCSKDQSAVSMTTARGTLGYIAPEVFSRNFGNVSYKSDVYSFGMLLLEMVGGRKNVDDAADGEQIYYPEWIHNLLEGGEDLRLNIEEGDVRIAKKLAIVGLWCIQWNPADRPSMKSVVQMLEGEGDSLPMPPNPFNSASSARTLPGITVRRLPRELEVIPEIE